MTSESRARNAAARRTIARRGRGERRGAVAIVVAVLLVALVGFTAFAIDFGQTFVFRAQLQTAADAGAMAGALELLHGRPALADDSARTYVAHNRAGSGAAGTELVEPGNFADATREFSPRASWTDADVNAVRVTAFHAAPYTFAPVLGLATRTVRAQAVGAIGSRQRASCMKPWAVPMANVLHALGKTGENPETYRLTDEDIAYLRDNQKLVAFKVGSQNLLGSTLDVATNSYISGNYYAVQYGPVRDVNLQPYSPGPTSGGNEYRDRIAGTLCHSGTVKPGDWLQVENGNMVGPTRQGTGDLCGISGNSQSFFCNPGVEVDLPIWSRSNGHREVQVSYVAKFVVTRYHQDQVYGYLTSRTGNGGSFSGTPGPIRAAALVR